MKKVAILLIAASVMVGCHDASARTSSLDIRVMTFNVKQQNPRSQGPKDAPTHWARRKAMVFDILRDYSPDIVGLQEPYRSQLDDIRKAFPKYGEAGEGRDGGNRGEHCSILYRANRFRVDESGTFWLSDTPEKRSRTWGHFYHRICTWARLVEKKSGSALYVFNTHLDHKSQSAREKSVRLIARRIHNRKHKDPFVLTGDFNAGEHDPVVTYLKGKHTEVSPIPVVDSYRMLHPNQKTVGTGNRFEGRADGEKIDYIFVPSGAKVLEASIIRTHKEGRYPSDHFPVTANIRFHAADDEPPLDFPDPGRKPGGAGPFTPPANNELLKTLRPTHPRLLLRREDLPWLRKTVRNHPVLSRCYASLNQSAIRAPAQRPAACGRLDRRRLLSVRAESGSAYFSGLAGSPAGSCRLAEAQAGAVASPVRLRRRRRSAWRPRG